MDQTPTRPPRRNVNPTASASASNRPNPNAFTDSEQLLIRQTCHEYLTLNEIPPHSLPTSILTRLSHHLPQHTPTAISQHWQHILSPLPPIYPPNSPALRFQALQTQLSSLTNDLAIQQTQTTILSHDLHRRVTRATRLTTAKTATLADSNRTLTARVERLVEERDSLGEETTRLRDTLKERHLECVRLQAENERRRVEAGGFLHEEVRVLAARAEGAEKRVEELEGVVGGLRVEVENYSEEIRLLTESDGEY